MRKLKTRLGASFCFALIVVFAGLFIFVFGESNVSETVSLMPAGTNSSIDLDDYGRLNITVRMVGPRLLESSATCEDLVEFRLDDGFKCSISSEGDAGELNAVKIGIASCIVRINCIAGISIAGEENLVLGLPDRFQTIEWALWHEQWDGNEKTRSIYEKFGPKYGYEEGNTSVANLAGSMKDPTTLSFGVVRSVVQDNRNYDIDIDSACATGGLHLNWRGVNRVQSTQGTESGMHYISFQFQVEETVYRKNLERKQTTTNRLSVVITYCLTVIGLMNSVKSKLQNFIDKVYIYRAKKLGKELPKDIQRRIRVLYEHAITEQQSGHHRRLSSKPPLMDIEMDDLNGEKGIMENVSPIVNPLVENSEELKGLADGDAKALMKRILMNYERVRVDNDRMRRDNNRMHRDNDRMRKENEMLRKQVVSLDTTVSRLASIVWDSRDDSLRKDSVVERPLPVGWQAFETEDGSKYYCGPDGRTTWEPPGIHENK